MGRRYSTHLSRALNIPMSISPETLINLVNIELAAVNDDRVVEHIEKLIVTPKMTMRQWDYGEVETRYPCWSILEHEKSVDGFHLLLKLTLTRLLVRIYLSGESSKKKTNNRRIKLGFNLGKSL